LPNATSVAFSALSSVSVLYVITFLKDIGLCIFFSRDDGVNCWFFSAC
jgi:hypothetical protein